MIVGCACFLLVLLANIVLYRLSSRVEENSRHMSVYIEVSKSRGVSKLLKAISDSGFEISSMIKSREKTIQSTDIALIIDIDFDRRRSHQEVINMISDLDYVSYVEEV